MARDFRSAVVADLNSARLRMSQMENRLNDTQGRPLTITEQQALTEVQARYDDLYRGIEAGGSPHPLRGERPDSYEARLIGQLQRFADPSLRDMDVARLNRVDSNAFDHVASEIARSVQRVIDDPAQGSFKDPTQLREVKVPDRSGRVWSEFRGPFSAWARQFMYPSRCVVAINAPLRKIG